MRTLDQLGMAASADRVFAVAADVERWPAILPHYRWVRVVEGRPGTGGGRSGCVVEMAAWRPFGPARYPAWWMSEMQVDAAKREIRFRHIRGITTGMDVRWTVTAEDGGRRALATIEHQWEGPRWPLIGALAANLVIGPVFIHGIASRTLAGIRRAVEGEPS